MNNVYTIKMMELARTGILAGGAAGVAVQREILATMAGRLIPVCYLEFSGVECATASFIREAVFGTRDALRRAGSPTQLVLLNADASVQEETLLIARALGSTVVCATGNNGGLSNPLVLGTLDEAQRETLSLVLKLGEATASELAGEKSSVRPTAWNNRLANLVSRGLLIEGKRDRHNVYRPVLEGLSYGI